MSSNQNNTGRILRFAALVVVVLGTLIAGCGGSDKWMGGVDAVFKYYAEDRRTQVIDVKPDSRSMGAGFEPGDRVLAVDGQDITKATLGEVKAAMRGPVGTFAVFTVQRGSRVLEITVERTPDEKKDTSAPAGEAAEPRAE